MKTKSQATRRVLSMIMAFAMILTLLPAAAFAAEQPAKLYLKPNSNWLIDNARFAAYFFGSNGYTWCSMTDPDGDGIYELEVPEGAWTNVIFCRMNPSNTTNDWNNKWNQTADLPIPTDGTNLYTVKSGTWDQGGGTWSTHTPAAEEETTAPAETTLPASDPVTVYFVNSDGWDEVYAYVWDASQEYAVAWPGTVMTGTGEQVNGFDVYEITSDGSYINIIFHDNLGNQTADLTQMDGQYFDFASNAWYESIDDIPYVDPLVTPHVLVGGFNSWSVIENVFMLETEGSRIGYTSLDLEADTTYEFKIIRDGSWTSCETPIVGTAANLAFNSSVSGNAAITTTIAGTYVFAFNLDDFTLSVTYPECDHNYVDGVCTNCGENEPIEYHDLIVYYDNSDTQWETPAAGVSCSEGCWDNYMPMPMQQVEGDIFSYSTTATCNHNSVTLIVASTSDYESEFISQVYFYGVENGDTVKHTHAFADGYCTACGETDPDYEAPAEYMTIYFQNNWLWLDVNLYYWGSSTAEDPVWNGIPMELYGNDGTYDIYCLEVPTDITGMIINGTKDDGSGSLDQTPDIVDGWYDGICYYMKWENGNAVGSEDIENLGVILPPEEDPDEPGDSPDYTIYFDPQGAAIDSILGSYHCDEHWDRETRNQVNFEYDGETGLWVATFQGSCSEGCVEQIFFEMWADGEYLAPFTEDVVDGKTYTVPSTDPTITQKGRNLSYQNVIYVLDIFELKGIDFEEVDITTDAGILVWSVEEYEALTEIAYDEAHAKAGLKPYQDTEYYYGTSDSIFTRDLHEEAYYVGYVKLSDGSYIYSEAKLYSPAIYAYNMLGKDGTSAETKELCIALLNYISAAQMYFYPDTAQTDLVNADLTAEQKALSWNNPELNLAPTVPSDKQVDRDTAVFTGTGKNLLFEEMISLISAYKIDSAIVNEAQECGTIFWTAEQFEALNGAPNLDNIGEGKKVTGFHVYKNTDGQWYSAAPAVAPKDMAQTQYYILGYVIHADGTVSYSGVMSYTFEQYISNMAANAKIGEFAQRLYYYERAAQAALG